MDANTCNINHSNADALLPPRKRLLAGLKRRNPEVNSPLSLPSTPGSVGSGNGSCLNIYRFQFQFNNPTLSDEGILDASRIAALEAARVAEIARAHAEEKAAKAARAVAVAKSALEFVTSLLDDAAATTDDDEEEFPKKSKMKKHVYVEALYNNRKDNSNLRVDEELACRLHRVINRCPRNLNNSFNLTNRKHKKLKHSANDAAIEEVNSEGQVKKTDASIASLNTSNQRKDDQTKWDNREQRGRNKTKGLKWENVKVEMVV